MVRQVQHGHVVQRAGSRKRCSIPIRQTQRDLVHGRPEPVSGVYVSTDDPLALLVLPVDFNGVRRPRQVEGRYCSTSCVSNSSTCGLTFADDHHRQLQVSALLFHP